MSNLIGKTAVMALALTSVLALTACDVDQTQEGDLPNVDVTAEGGELPAYDVETPEVDMDTNVEMPNESDAEVTDEPDSAADDEVGDQAEDGAG